MTLELSALIAAVPIGVAALVKSMLMGKEFAKNGSNNGNGLLNGFTAEVRRDHALMQQGLVDLRSETKEQTAVMREMRDNLRDLCGTIRTNIPRN